MAAQAELAGSVVNLARAAMVAREVLAGTKALREQAVPSSISGT